MTLARELSLAEVEHLAGIASDLGLEVEAFAHGALCVCYSGQCFMSSMIGGRSANRGLCAQACRLPYELRNRAQRKELPSPGEHLLSPQDLCVIDLMPELVAAGALQEILLNPEDVKSRNLSGSVEAATMDGKLYAYPMTADNGYFLYYDKSVLSEDDVKSMDTLLAKADASGKKFMMSLNDAWYVYSFYAGAGLKATLADDGVNTVCNWNEAPGADVTQAILDMSAQPAFKSGADADIVSGIKDGSCCAAISGTWNANTAQETWGDNYAATKLPTYTLNGEQVQMASFSGYKLVGVNPHSANVGVAMMLADYITNEDNQAKRFNDRQLGPSNIAANESEAVQSAPAIAALAEQSDYATLQRVGANYWSSAESLGEILASGDTQGKTTQQLVDDAVAGITAPVTQ